MAQSNLNNNQQASSKQSSNAFNPNSSLNNQKQSPMPNYAPQQQQQPPNAAIPNQPQMAPFRPPSTNQYLFNESNSGDSSLNNSLNNSLSHNEQFPQMPPNQQQQLNTSNSTPYPPHHMNAAEHYQNMSRTHSPLAQRLMQQKSPVVIYFYNFISIFFIISLL
jgi:hypothetical protein